LVWRCGTSAASDSVLCQRRYAASERAVKEKVAFWMDTPTRQVTAQCGRSPRTADDLEGAVSQQAAGVRTGLAVLHDGDLPVHQHEAVSARALDATPLATREVVRHLGRQAGQLLEVVDHQVGRRPLGEQAAIAEARAVGGQGGEPPVRVLERAHRLVAND